jgi:transcriptional regulator
LATIISLNGDAPEATHIPIELEINEQGEKVLWGHLSKANPQWQSFTGDSSVLVIFLSDVSHYISSSWYGHPNAPTWNYMSVHVTGKIKIIEGEQLWESVRRLTNRHEQIATHPVSLDTLPASVQKQMTGIVGFEVSMDKVQCAFKLSQNRNDADYANIISELRLLNTSNALLMARHLEQQRNLNNM